MASTFNCPACSAPLDFHGTTTQTCDFCSATVIVPSQMFGGGNVRTPARAASFGELTGDAMAVAEVQGLLAARQKVDAVKRLRDHFALSLAEAKDIADAMERGEQVTLRGVTVEASTESVRQVLEIKKGIGSAVERNGLAIKLFAIVPLFVIVVAVAATGYVVYQRFRSSNETSNTAPAMVTETLRIGGEGVAPGSFQDNRHAAVDGSGNIYGTNFHPVQIQVFAADGTFIRRWDAEEKVLHAMAADTAGGLYLATNVGVVKYDGMSGKRLAANKEIRARGIATLPDGGIAAAASRSLVFLNAELKIIRKIEITTAERPLRLEEIAVSGDGAIYAADHTEKNICKFSSSGELINRFGGNGDLIRGLAVDRQGRLFVSRLNIINVYSPNGSQVAEFPVSQTMGMTFTPTGELLVASRPYMVKYRLNF